MPVIPAGYRGDVTLGVTLRFLFNTTDVADAPVAFAGSTPTLAAYVDGGTTQVTAGLTLTQALDSVVGLHLVTAVLTSGNGYAAATDVVFVIEAAATVDGVSATGKIVGSCSIQNRSVAALATSAEIAALPTASETADAVGAHVVEGTTTVDESLRLANAANAGKVSGAATTNVKIRDLADTKDRIDATVDASGNRTAVTRDVS